MSYITKEKDKDREPGITLTRTYEGTRVLLNMVTGLG